MIDFMIGIKRLEEVPACPLCGCSTVKESRKWAQHCSGYWNESVEFDCGQKYEFSPNFMCVGLVYDCKRNPEFKARVKLVEDVKAELIAHGKKRGLSEADQKQLEDKLQYFAVSTWH